MNKSLIKEETMNNRILWLRICYWTGAIIDTLAAIPLMFPQLAAWIFQWPESPAGNALRSVSGSGAALMWGWTALLLWADRKPMERKGVLLLTLFPVLFGMIANRIVDLINGFIPLSASLPFGILQIVLVGLFSFSYINASKTKGSQ
jgi:hypothetical protein